VGVVITQIGPKAWVAMDESERSLNANSPKANPFKSPQIISPSVIHPRPPPIQILFNSSILKDLLHIYVTNLYKISMGNQECLWLI